MPVSLRRLAALATVLLAIAAVVVLGLRGMGVQVAVGPLASPTPVPSPSASVTPAPSASVDPATVFAQIEAEVRQIRGLPAPSIGPVELIDRAALEARLRANLDRDYPKARRDADNLLLHGLGLLAADQEVGALQLQLLSGQVIGYYDDRARQMVVITGSGVGPEAKVTYAHEYTHALQDKAFGLAALDTEAVGQDDRDLARLSLVEGDATTVMTLWAVAHLTPEELLGVSQLPQPDMTGIPAWMVEQLEFPYLAGSQFVSRLYASGGWSAVDAVFRDPPSSTEQILHYDKYVAGEQPDGVAAPALAKALGAGWSEAPADTMGEEMIDIWLKALGAPAADATSAGEGWGGDRVVAASGPGGGTVIAWRIAWDAPADATQFAAAYREASGLKLAHRLVQLSPTETLVVQASSAALVDRAVSGLR